eukprot:SAG31_NODE_86_length_26973_cov_16.850897_4_plen_48_part_00
MVLRVLNLPDGVSGTARHAAGWPRGVLKGRDTVLNYKEATPDTICKV